MADSVNADDYSGVGAIIKDPVYRKILPGIRGKLKGTDSLIKLNELCSRCHEFPQRSPILHSLSQDKTGQNENINETHEFGILRELLLSYREGCHLCALFWNSLFEDVGRDRSPNLDAKLQVRVKLKSDPLEEEKPKKIYKEFLKNMTPNARSATLELMVDEVREEIASALLNISTETSKTLFRFTQCHC